MPTDRKTERSHADSLGIDTLRPVEIASRLHAGQLAATEAVASVLGELAAGASAMADSVRTGASLVYAGAGSSGLMAAADAMELAGTFGITPTQVRILMPGGLPTDATLPGHVEDDVDQAATDALSINSTDSVIIVSASGSTPYALSLARAVRERGATTICLANNAGSPLFEHASIAVCISTPEELIAGSTRLGAGTAQKVALNTMSTLMGVALGHIYDGMMVNVRADNDKLRQRATSMVARIADVSDSRARDCLNEAAGEVKLAVLLAAGATSTAGARDLLAQCADQLRPALARLTHR